MYDISDYFEAASIKEVLDYLKENADSKIISGGTDVLIKSRESKNGYTNLKLVGITRISQLKEIKEHSNGDIFIGSACTFTEVEKSKLINEKIKILSIACGTVGGPQVRNAGTIGGNICNGATSADCASSLFCFKCYSYN